MSHAEIFGETSYHPGDSAPLQPRFGFLWLLTFPKTNVTFEREEISDPQWDSGKYNGVTDGDCENCMRSQGAYFEGDWGVISYVQCSLYLVSSSINVSVFHITWLDTFWTDLIYVWRDLPWEVAPGIMEAEICYDIPSAFWRTRKAGLTPKAWEHWGLLVQVLEFKGLQTGNFIVWV